MIATLGELLIDFLPSGAGKRFGAGAYHPAAGGAPANVAVGAARLGRRAAFLGKVGDDLFGRGLALTLEEEGVDVRGLLFDPDVRTGLAFVSLSEAGEREFSFFRHPSADMRFRPEEVDREVLREADILHFGSISLISEPARAATLLAIDTAKDSGAMISYDPNLREALWPGSRAAREGMMLGWERASVVKASEEELEFLTGSRERSAARELMLPDLKLLLVTRGARGASFLTPWIDGDVEGFDVSPVDTTGAGDSFMASMLSSLVQQPDLAEDEQELRVAVRRANACAALCVGRGGAIPALPRHDEVEEFLARQRLAGEQG